MKTIAILNLKGGTAKTVTAATMARCLSAEHDKQLWQAHDASAQPDWSPDKAVSLWDLCHTKDPALATDYQPPQGTRGLWQEGECCVQVGHIWRCLTADNAYSPSELPERWEDLGTVEREEAAE